MEAEVQREHLKIANIEMSDEEIAHYLKYPDEVRLTGTVVPKGYKVCTGCGSCKKIALFNKNNMSKDGHTSRCKECQKGSAKKSYAKNKHKKTYLKYYQEHKEQKAAQSRKYYQEHKDELKKKHAAYRNTKQGKTSMQKAHSKRGAAMKVSKGIPYTRELVVDRDRQGGTYPICYLCGKEITTPGALHLDHVIPIVVGGPDCFTNVACVHSTCNLTKSKDAAEISEEHVTKLQQLSDAYMDAHHDKFPSIFGTDEGGTETADV